MTHYEQAADRILALPLRWMRRNTSPWRKGLAVFWFLASALPCFAISVPLILAALATEIWRDA